MQRANLHPDGFETLPPDPPALRGLVVALAGSAQSTQDTAHWERGRPVGRLQRQVLE